MTSPAVARYLWHADSEEFDVMHAHSHCYFTTNLAALKRQMGRSVGDHEPRTLLTERTRTAVHAVPKDDWAVDVQPGGCRVLLHRRGQRTSEEAWREIADRGGGQRNRHGAVHPGGPRRAT